MRYKMNLNTSEFGTIQFQYENIDKDRQEFPLCDINGNEVKKIAEQQAKSHFENKKGEVIPKEQVYRIVNGKVARKFSKTKDILKYEIVPKVEAHDLLKEHYYQLVSSTASAQRLMDYLSREDRALKFSFSNGNGYKKYQAYLLDYGGVFVMMLGYGYLTEQIHKEMVFESREEKKKMLEIVAEADLEAL